MSDSADLDDVYAAICADPADDAPRLAWADLVDRLYPNDQERIDRAHYVRLCVRNPGGDVGWRHKDREWLEWINRHSLPRWQMREVTTLFNLERQELSRRAMKDSSAYRELRDLDAREGSGGYKAVWQRGWVNSLEMGAVEYARMHELLHRSLPLTRIVLDASGVPNPIVAITVAHAVASHARTLGEIRFYGGVERSREDLSRLTLEASPELADGRVSFANY